MVIGYSATGALSVTYLERRDFYSYYTIEIGEVLPLPLEVKKLAGWLSWSSLADETACTLQVSLKVHSKVDHCRRRRVLESRLTSADGTRSDFLYVNLLFGSLSEVEVCLGRFGLALLGSWPLNSDVLSWPFLNLPRRSVVENTPAFGHFCLITLIRFGVFTCFFLFSEYILDDIFHSIVINLQSFLIMERDEKKEHLFILRHCFKWGKARMQFHFTQSER